jgi:rRNA biogenesis protein RRP5
MSAKKRALEETTSAPKAKKVKLARDAGKAPKKAGVSKPAKRVESPEPVTHVSTLVPDEIDFPRGGGTSFTPLEVKAIRQEGMDEANEEVFQVCCL